MEKFGINVVIYGTKMWSFFWNILPLQSDFLGTSKYAPILSRLFRTFPRSFRFFEYSMPGRGGDEGYYTATESEEAEGCGRLNRNGKGLKWSKWCLKRRLFVRAFPTYTVYFSMHQKWFIFSSFHSCLTNLYRHYSVTFYGTGRLPRSWRERHSLRSASS